MTEYVVKRLLLSIPTFVGITLITFFVIRLAPGDPVRAMQDDSGDSRISASSYELLRQQFGLDQPLYVQYGRWVKRLVTLDFGRSFRDRRPVWDKVAERLPWTLSLSALSLFVGFGVSLWIGTYSAYRRGSRFDRGVGTLLYALYSVPNYVTAMALLGVVVGCSLDWVPIRGAYSDNFDELGFAGKLWDLGKHFFLITICFTYPSLAFQSRFVRGTMLEALQQDYVRTARAKGLSERIIVMRHGLRNALIPLVTFAGLVFPTILAGSVILEAIFSWPGIGELLYSSVLARDYPTVMALSSLGAVLVLIGTLAADLAYVVVDPRVRHAQLR